MPAKKSPNVTGPKSFPHKLHALLESAASSEVGFSHIISWQAGGKSFRVHQPKVFVKSILPQHFKQTKFKSFLRQLNIYGFQRIQHGPNKGGYAHAHLVQGRPEHCAMIRRVSAPDGKAAQAIAGAAATAAAAAGAAAADQQQHHQHLPLPNSSASASSTMLRRRNQSEMQHHNNNNNNGGGSSSNLSVLSGLSGLSGLSELSALFHKKQQQQSNQQQQQHLQHHYGSTGSLGSLGSLGMGGPEANFVSSGQQQQQQQQQQNEPFNLDAAAAMSGGASLSSAFFNHNSSANSLGLNSLGMLSSFNENHRATGANGNQQQNAPFRLAEPSDDMANHNNHNNNSRPFHHSLQHSKHNHGSALSLLSNLSGGNFSVGSVNSLKGLRMQGSDLNFFKDLFQPSDLEGDVPMLCPSTSRPMMGNHHPRNNGGGLKNAVFDTTQIAGAPPSHITEPHSYSHCHSHKHSSSAPTYVSDNGFLQKKRGLFEPSTDELLGLISDGIPGDSQHMPIPNSSSAHAAANHHQQQQQQQPYRQTNEDLNRSESVFPTKLHRMLQDSKREGFEHIVSWIHGGTAFKVHDVTQFMNQIMPIYFDQSKFESFRRQLNLYGFTRVTRGPSRGMYYHQDFVQNDVSLCRNITRPKSVRNRRKASASADDHDDDNDHHDDAPRRVVAAAHRQAVAGVV